MVDQEGCPGNSVVREDREDLEVREALGDGGQVVVGGVGGVARAEGVGVVGGGRCGHEVVDGDEAGRTEGDEVLSVDGDRRGTGGGR